MARYQVPQFLEVEDKIFGPLTLKQFLYSGAGAAIMFTAWQTLPRVLAIIAGVPFLVLFLALAFYQVNKRPLSLAIENALKYFFSSKLFLWKKRDKTPKKQVAEVVRNATQDVPTVSNSKLKDLAWGLDIHETLNTLEDLEKPKQ